jgi:hypothetical protein
MYNKDMHCNKAVFVKDKVLRENKMQLNFRQQFNTIAKQAVQMHGSNWLAINGLSCDRTPESYFSSGFLEGAGYA